jgi:hypothetical protein
MTQVPIVDSTQSIKQSIHQSSINHGTSTLLRAFAERERLAGTLRARASARPTASNLIGARRRVGGFGTPLFSRVTLARIEIEIAFRSTNEADVGIGRRAARSEALAFRCRPAAAFVIRAERAVERRARLRLAAAFLAGAGAAARSSTTRCCCRGGGRRRRRWGSGRCRRGRAAGSFVGVLSLFHGSVARARVGLRLGVLEVSAENVCASDHDAERSGENAHQKAYRCGAGGLRIHCHTHPFCVTHVPSSLIVPHGVDVPVHPPLNPHPLLATHSVSVVPRQ